MSDLSLVIKCRPKVSSHGPPTRENLVLMDAMIVTRGQRRQVQKREATARTEIGLEIRAQWDSSEAVLELGNPSLAEKESLIPN